MPAHKRSLEYLEEDSQERHHYQQFQHQQQDTAEEEDDREDSNGSPSSSSGVKDEFIFVKLSDIRKEVQCPICLGIIRKTRTVMECLHRFCRECIDKSMRLGNNECPACRTHCASRRSLRDDPNYDALIAALYPNIDKYEEEELAFHEEEKVRNKQIQASIAQTICRQSEALGKRRTTAKATAAAFMRKSQGNARSTHLRGRRKFRATDLSESDDDDEDGNDNDVGQDSSSADERIKGFKQKRFKRWGPRSSRPSIASNADGGCDENDDLGMNRESASPGFVGNPEVLAWGKGGVRSNGKNARSSRNGKNTRSSRATKLAGYLKSLEGNDNELDIHLMLLPLDKQSIRSLQRPYLCCRPTLSIRHLCQYVALQTLVRAEEIEIVVVKEPVDDLISKAQIDPSKDEVQILDAQETLAGLQANCTYNGGHLVLAYRQKASSSL